MKMSIVRAPAIGVLLVGALGFLSVVVAETPKSQWDGVYTPAQMKRGDPLYVQHCAICHGMDLLGGEMAPPLIGGQFTSNWNETSLADLFERIRVSMPLNAPGTLSRQETADILAYMLAKGDYPSGAVELATQTEVLNMIKFIAAKP